MAQDEVIPAQIDALQRTVFDSSSLTPEVPQHRPLDAGRPVWHVQGIGRTQKDLTSGFSQLQQKDLVPRADLILGMFALGTPIVYLVEGDAAGVSIRVGTWTHAGTPHDKASMGEDLQEAVHSLLSSLYPSLGLEAVSAADPSKYTHAALMLGVPTAKPAGLLDLALPMDRLIRGMADSNWGYLVLAEPVPPDQVRGQRDMIINTLRTTEAFTETKAHTSLGTYFKKLLERRLEELTLGLSLGCWRTAVYLLGDDLSYMKLISVCRGVFAGEESVSEPIHLIESDPAVLTLAERWALPEERGRTPAGYFRHLYQYQSLLTSTQLATFAHLPNLETAGFKVELVPEFDTVTPELGDREVSIGHVIRHRQASRDVYGIPVAALTRHSLVCGVTGSGKTNTVLRLLLEADRLKAPFLVLEPSKAEYRTLLREAGLANRLNVFTLGEESISPFRLNPFEVPDHVGIQQHIDLLRSVFSVSFGMWTPLPQVLERCLYEIYTDAGWDITTRANSRIPPGTKTASWTTFPTLADLRDKVDEVVNQLGYEAQVSDNIRAALTTRVDSLRAGGKGRMLDTRRSIPVEVWLDHPTIMELEGISDDDDKAFVMGLLLIRLVEHRRKSTQPLADVADPTKGRSGPRNTPLRNLLVVEEAHRLLVNVAPGKQKEEESNPRGKAVEAFSNLMSEVRAYGQGIVIADQVPVRLAPDVIKNTNLKIAHRTVAEEDREALAGSMAMNENQSLALATLVQGEAAVFAEGEDSPILVLVLPAKDRLGSPPTTDEVRLLMSENPMVSGIADLLLPSPDCDGIELRSAHRYFDHAKRLLEGASFRRDLARMVLCLTEPPSKESRALWSDLLDRIDAGAPTGAALPEYRAVALGLLSDWFARRRGRQGEWSYADTEGFSRLLRAALRARVAGASGPAVKAFQDCFHRVHRRDGEPYRGCARICIQAPAECLYRYPVQDVIMSTRGKTVENGLETASARDVVEEFNGWLVSDSQTANGSMQGTWSFCESEARKASGTDPVGLRRASLCYAQQLLTSKLPASHLEWLDRLLKASGDGAE